MKKKYNLCYIVICQLFIISLSHLSVASVYNVYVIYDLYFITYVQILVLIIIEYFYIEQKKIKHVFL